ncbi:DUF3784 domain-containing protein [Olleya sp. HaHaR_3_96]|uniref:DUF3784 domain-containing protein n=1 Tax=Olleya sp. HaHaR_3_96 TaxID=2745560 RepID=UPI001C4F7E2C|nr:DUF3784 domain-containing protein [Olleya sp. HaHaR_3_96]QXP58514.1 DUF3784 domain-containing protein [Olleya sp. HaHaR_3_96]
MIYSQLLISFILIIFGFLVKKYPDLIAGYNTLSHSEKEKIDSKGLASFLQRLLIGLGVFCLFTYLLLKICNVNDNSILYINSALLISVLIISRFIANRRFKL